MRRVLITGSRYWTDRNIIWSHLSVLPVGSVVIHGAARGADRLAGESARQLGLEVEEYMAEWNRFGRAAGPIRNKRMLTEGMPTEVWAFHEDLAKSRGTRDMVERARRAGIPVRLVTG